MASAGLGLDEPTSPDEILDALEQHAPSVTRPEPPRPHPDRDQGGPWVEPAGDAIGDRLRRHHERWQTQPTVNETPRGSAQLAPADSANTARRTPRRTPRSESRSLTQRARGGRPVLALAAAAAVVAVAVGVLLVLSSTGGSPRSARRSATHRARTTAAVNGSASHHAAAPVFAFVDRLHTETEQALGRAAYRVNQRAADEQQARERARERHQKAVADKRAQARKRAEARKRAKAQAHVRQGASETTTTPSQSYTPIETSPSTVATTAQSSEPASNSSSSSSSASGSGPAGPTGVGEATGGCNPQCH